MRLESARELKNELIEDIVNPLTSAPGQRRRGGARVAFLRVGDLSVEAALNDVRAQPLTAVPQVPRFLALGVAPHGRSYRLAIRLQRAALQGSELVDHMVRRSRGEADVRLIGRIDKRTAAATPRSARAAVALPWFRRNSRPLLIGSSIGHFEVTAGTLGAFVDLDGSTGILSNNHVLANEDRAAMGDAILQRATLDGGRSPADVIGRLQRSIRLKPRRANRLDVAVARLDEGIAWEPGKLRAIAGGRHRALAGVGDPADIAQIVYKIGRTTGVTRGRVTAFELDHLIADYDIGNLRFDGQIEIDGVGARSFSAGGDSGSLILNADMEAVALLFAGTERGGRANLGLTYATPIDRVLSALKATLLF
jgi:S1-C subfamily serine protease